MGDTGTRRARACTAAVAMRSPAVAKRPPPLAFRQAASKPPFARASRCTPPPAAHAHRIDSAARACPHCLSAHPRLAGRCRYVAEAAPPAFLESIAPIEAAGCIPGVMGAAHCTYEEAEDAKNFGELKGDALTVDEVAFLMKYSSEDSEPPLYKDMNDKAYDKDRKKIASYGKYMVGTVKSMGKIEPYGNKTVFRGVKVDLSARPGGSGLAVNCCARVSGTGRGARRPQRTLGPASPTRGAKVLLGYSTRGPGVPALGDRCLLVPHQSKSTARRGNLLQARTTSRGASSRGTAFAAPPSPSRCSRTRCSVARRGASRASLQMLTLARSPAAVPVAVCRTRGCCSCCGVTPRP